MQFKCKRMLLEDNCDLKIIFYLFQMVEGQHARNEKWVAQVVFLVCQCHSSWHRGNTTLLQECLLMLKSLLVGHHRSVQAC